MKVLHVYPKSDALIRQHVTLLADGMRQSADVQVADSTSSFRQYLHEMEPDVVHCHGCWHYYLARAAASARNIFEYFFIVMLALIVFLLGRKDNASREKKKGVYSFFIPSRCF